MEKAWTPLPPLVVAGQKLEADAAWFYVFIETWIRLTHGCDDDDDTAELCAELYWRHYMRHPAEVALEIYQRQIDVDGAPPEDDA